MPAQGTWEWHAVGVSSVCHQPALFVRDGVQVGKFDPVTRKPLDAMQLVPNLALKEAISAYLEANPWAYESDPAL